MAHIPTRREILLGGAAFSLAAAPSYAALAQHGPAPRPTETATGTIRDVSGDLSGAKGRAVPGVLVSNGIDVVRTDAAGRYSLPVAPGQSIFMIKPAGYQVPVDPETQLPRFSYVHDPEGTPPELRFRYHGMPATGPLPASIDFELTRAAEPDKFDVLLFTDPQPETAAEVAYIRDDVVAGLIGTNAAFGINCGDIAFNDLAMYDRINRVIGRIGVPFWNIGGNHDFDCEALDCRRSRDTYKHVFGAPYCAHEHGKVLFIMLDNVQYLGIGKGYRGFIPPEQLTFVANLLKQTPLDRLIVLAMHVPLKTHIGDAPNVSTVNAADLLALLGDRPAVSFSGHTHSTEHHYLGADAGFSGPLPHHHHVLTAVSGAWWSGPQDHRGIPSADAYDGSPNGHHVLSIDGTGYSTRFVAAGEANGRQMRISLGCKGRSDDKPDLAGSMVECMRSPVSLEQAGNTRVLVNLFDGGPRSGVEYAIDGGKPVGMTRVWQHDPFFEQVYGRHRETIKKWVEPQVSTHLWAADLPAGLGVGVYTLRVTATDEYGRRHSDGMILEIEDNRQKA